MNDPDSLAAAVQGADVVFAVTQCKYFLPCKHSCQIIDSLPVQVFETASSDGEVQQGLNIVNALENTRAHLIFSTFPIADIILANPEEYNDLQQWKSKVIIEKAALETLGSHRCSFVCCGMYMESFKTLFTPQKTSHGEYVLQAPFPTSTEMPLLSADRDTGLFVIPILLSPASYAGKYLYAATESPAFTDIARILSEVTGKQVIARESSERSFWDEQMPPQMRPLEPVMNGMLRFIREHGLFGKNEKEGISWTLQVSDDPLASNYNIILIPAIPSALNRSRRTGESSLRSR